MKRSTTKRALWLSVVSMFLCLTMFMGTTFAWFTDEVTSGTNTIVAGNLDVELYNALAADIDDANKVTATTKLFELEAPNLWEPGAVVYENLTVANEGNLALKYRLTVNIFDAIENANGDTLAKVLKVAVVPGGVTTTDRDVLIDSIDDGDWLDFKTFELTEPKLEAGDGTNPTTKTYGIVIWWEPSDIDNEFNMNNLNKGKELSVKIGVNLFATQVEAEKDSFDNKYDEGIEYPESAIADIPAGTTLPTDMTVGDVTVTLPAGVSAGTYTLETGMPEATTENGKTAIAIDITLKKDGVTVTDDGTEYDVVYDIGKNLEVVSVTHAGEAVDPYYYDPTTGILSFKVKHFSPFVFVTKEADDNSVFVPADPDAAEKLDKAEVVAVDENGNEYTSITDAVKSGASKLYFKEGADLGDITHLDVANDLVIYGNGAKLSGDTRDLAVNFNVKLDKDVTVTVYNLHGIGFWGNSSNGYTLNLNLYNCNDVSEVFVMGTSGVNNIALYNCTFNKDTLYKESDTGVYSNANGSITIDGCTFNGIPCPVNLNHKISGEQTVTVKDTAFVDCATEGTAAYYAPIRLYNNTDGANQTLTVAGNTFTYSEGKAPINGADILLNAKHDGVDAAGTIKATVQAGADVVCGVNVDVTFEINTAEELFAFAADVNKYSNYERPFDGQTVKLMNDIDLGGAEWTPIGDYRFSANRFCGTFDGQGYTISNFKITKKTDKNDSNKSSYGFFGNMEGTVKNLTIDKANICSYAYVGALIGRLNSGTVENCHVTNSAVETTYWQAGGMIGQLNDACTVKDCTITNTTVTGASAIGGMFGPLTATGSDKTLLFENNTVKDCTVVQKGSFGENYDVLFGAMFNDIDVADNQTDINNCKVENTTVKGVVSNALFGSLSGTKVYFDGYTYVSDGLYQNGVNYRVYNANGLETLNAKMADKSAGRGVVVELMADIDFAGKTWTTIDSHVDFGFTLKEFNGNYHTISNLTVNGQAMFRRFANNANVVIKNVTFDNATVSNSGINTALIVGQTYNNLILDNVDVKNSSVTGGYKVATLVGTVYNESTSAITLTVKNCDVDKCTVTSTQYDFMTCGLVAFVYVGDNDKVEFENTTISNVALVNTNSGGYNYHAYVYYNDQDTNDCFNEAEGVTVTNCTFEALQ